MLVDRGALDRWLDSGVGILEQSSQLALGIALLANNGVPRVTFPGSNFPTSSPHCG